MTPYEFSETALLDWLGQFLWTLFRVAAMFMVAPLFGARYIPTRVRVTLAFACSIAIFPMLPPGPDVAPFSAQALLLVAQQILIGIAAGFILQLVFDAIVIGIQTVSMSMGLGFAIFIDSQNGVQVPVLSQLHLLLAMLLFLSFDGHLMIVALIVDSFQLLPVSAGGLSPEAFWTVASWGTTLFIGAVKVALPAATAVLIVNMSIGVISRAAPTLNLFAIGLPLTIVVGLIVLIITLPSLEVSLIFLLEQATATINSLWLMVN